MSRRIIINAAALLGGCAIGAGLVLILVGSSL